MREPSRLKAAACTTWPKRRTLISSPVLPLLIQACRIGFLAGVQEGALQLCDFGRVCPAFADPDLDSIKVVAAQKQRLRPTSHLPARRKLAKPRVFTDPLSSARSCDYRLEMKPL
jgi:hypothetical protein